VIRLLLAQMKPFNRRVLKRALWSSMSRLIGIVLGAGAGSLLYKLTGGSLVQGWGSAPFGSLLRTVFENGAVVKEYALEEVRARAAEAV